MSDKNSITIQDNLAQTILYRNSGIITVSQSLWVDSATVSGTNTFYICNESVAMSTGVNTLTWYNNLGVAVTPPNLQNLVNLNDSTTLTLTQLSATAVRKYSTAGYTVDDTIMGFYVTLTNANSATIYEAWVNLTSGTVLTAIPLVNTYNDVIIYQKSGGGGSSGGSSGGTATVNGSVSVTGTVTVSNQLTGFATDSNLSTLVGTPGSGINPPSGGSGLLGYLSKVSSLLSNPITAARNWNLTNTSDSVNIGNFPSNQNVTVTSSVLPSGAATDSSLQSILTALQATVNMAGSAWFDPQTNTYYVRIESVNEGTGVKTVSFENIGGTPVSITDTIKNRLQAVSNSQNISVTTLAYIAGGNGTGYSNGDHLYYVFGINNATNTGVPVFSYWFNSNTNAILTVVPSPVSQAAQAVSQNGTWTVSVSSLPNVTLNSQANGFAQESNGNLAALATAAGTSADLWTTGSSNASNIGLLKYIATAIKNTLGVNLNIGGTTVSSSNPVNISVDGVVVTGQTLPSGSGTIGWLSYLASFIKQLTFSGNSLQMYLAGKISTPTLRQNIGPLQTVTAVNAVNSGSYSVAADKLTIDTTGAVTSLTGALLADFSITPSFGATAPVTGSVQLIAVDWSLAATPVAGAAPTTTLGGYRIYTFSPQPITSNTLTSMIMRVNAVALSGKTDFYIYNTTGQPISTGWVLNAQCYTIGN